MRFGSVCSGIEAASVAWKALGWEPAWLAEIDVDASAVLAHRLGASKPVFLPDPEASGLTAKGRTDRRKILKSAKWNKIAWRDRITNWGDMTHLPALVRSGEAEAPDLLCGGTPCQGFSIAGLREGLKDPRGQLTLSFVELANAIDDKRAERGERPCVVFWENVPGVLTDKGNAFGNFIAGLAGETVPIEPPGGKWTNAGAVLGPKRAVAWVVKDAQYFGLAQRRARVFVVASALDGFDPGLVLFEFDGVRRDSAPIRQKGKAIASDLAPCLTGGGRGVARAGESRGQDPVVAVARVSEGAQSDVIVMAHGQAGAEIAFDRSPTLTCNHEAPIAAYALQAGVVRQNPSSGPDGMGVREELAYCLEARSEVQLTAYAFQPRIARNGRGDMGDLVNALTAQAGETGKGDAAPCVAVVHGTQDPISLDDMAFPLGRNSGQENVICFNPTQITHPNNGSNPQPGDPCHTLSAHAVAPTIVFAADICPTLRAGGNVTGGDRPPGTDVDTSDSNIVMSNMQVRRLLPIECERLQGFEDGWTDVPIGNRGAADGPRYKQLGNSWAVPVVRHIGFAIRAELRRLDTEELI